MSNFQFLMENENLLPIAEQVFKDSCQELLENLNEESIDKVQEYVELLSEKKTKKSLENEISEALSPILEKNASLYGTFLYDVQSIQESNQDVPALVTIRECSSAEYVANTILEQAQQTNNKSKLKTAGKIGAGLGAAGALGLAGKKAYDVATGEDDAEVDPKVDPKAFKDGDGDHLNAQRKTKPGLTKTIYISNVY